MCLSLQPVEIARRLFSIDVRGLAALRVSIGLLILGDLWIRSELLVEHYTDAGVMPREAVGLTQSGVVASLYMLDGSTWFAGLLFLMTALCAGLLVAGYKTRFAVVACLVLLLSLHERNALVCNAGDRLLTILLFWSMFLPLGAAWSVDRRSASSTADIRCVFSPASACLLLQIALLYFFSALHKLHPAWTGNHAAVYFALLSPYASEWGRQASEWPFPILQFLTAYVFRLELYGWLPAFSPFATGLLRMVVVAAFVSFHVGLAVLMSIGVFAWISAASWLVFLPPAFWDGIERLAGVKTSSSWSPESTVPARGHGLPEVILGWVPVLAMVYVVGVNVASLYPAVKLGEVQRWGERVGIYQRWSMFAPSPRRNYGWYEASARLADGTTLDLIRPENPIEAEPAPLESRGVASKPWRCYLSALTTRDGHSQIPSYVQWLRERWDERHPTEERVQAVDLRFEIEFIMPPGRPPLRTSADLYQWTRDGEERLAPLSASWDAVRAKVQDLRSRPRR